MLHFVNFQTILALTSFEQYIGLKTTNFHILIASSKFTTYLIIRTTIIHPLDSTQFQLPRAVPLIYHFIQG